MPDLDAYAAALLRVVDDVATGCAIFTSAGTLISTSPGLALALDERSDTDRVVAHSSAMARVLGAQKGDSAISASGTGSSSSAIATAAGRYELAACFLPRGMFGAERTIVVTVRFTAAEPPAADLVAKYRLTPREVEIAHLIAEGDSNQGIADRLQLSVRTVHHHAERVLRKLGVRGRAGVASRIFNK